MLLTHPLALNPTTSHYQPSPYDIPLPPEGRVPGGAEDGDKIKEPKTSWRASSSTLVDVLFMGGLHVESAHSVFSGHKSNQFQEEL